MYGLGLIGEECEGEFKTYHFDSRGSTVAITNEGGNITDTFKYDTYGNEIEHIGDSSVIFGYNGRDGVVTDKNTLIYMRARYYSPDMRRFVNADIIAGSISNAITLNRYAYANGNPVSFIDPFGLWSLKDAWKKVTTWVKKKVVEPVVKAGKKVAKVVSEAANQVIGVNRTIQNNNNNKVRQKQIKIVRTGASSVSNWVANTYNKVQDKIAEAYNDTLDWAIDNAPEPVANFAEDLKNYDSNNTDEQKVLDSNYFSSYKDTVVLKLPIKSNAFSYGFIGIGNEVSDTETVKHEYGHKVQWDQMGVINFSKDVALPSVTANVLDRMGKLPYDYYGSQWEAEADLLGGVSRTTNNTPWPSDAYNSYWDLIKMFFD